MKERNKGILLLALFGIWTKLVLTVDVEPAGETGKAVGFAAVNTRFHQWTGVHIYCQNQLCPDPKQRQQ